jgi:multicomponent Na+:H+ antiporter subunit D
MSAILLIAVPLLAAFISILHKKVAPYLLLLVSFSMVVIALFLPIQTVVIGGFEAPYGINLVYDTYSRIGVTAVNLLFFLITTIVYCKFKPLASILLVALAGLNGLLLTGDLFNLFVFMEVSGIAAYLITTSNNKPKATFHYLVIGTVGSGLYLFGLIILYAMFGTLNMADLASQITASNASAMEVAVPFMLMFIGLGVEAKLIPFNAWVKGILGSSNKLSGPMIASVYATTIAIVFGRVLTTVFVFSDQLFMVLSVITVFSILAGEAMAYASTKAREILLFSSIAQAGIVILLFVLGFKEIALTIAVVNGFSKFVLFVLTNHMVDQIGSDEINDLQGVFSKNKVVGVSFTIASLSLLGLPLFVGFVVKMNMLRHLINNGNLVFAIVILLSSVIEGVYFIKLLVKLWYEKGETKQVKFDFLTKYITLVIAILFIVFGLYFEPIQTLFDTLVPFEIGGIL